MATQKFIAENYLFVNKKNLTTLKCAQNMKVPLQPVDYATVVILPIIKNVWFIRT